ncbi:MAG: PSD1 and planctomycete cytochrome C domain-containing protein [Bryobacteraceae bacterium]|nr:PSD1 and planctomycete cytochrome C domain-containing protein [Bryobacteraceae bacterium]
MAGFRLLALTAVLLPTLLADPVPAAPPPDGLEFFEKKIRPVLARKCYACHSAASKPLRGRMSLDNREGMRRGGASGVPAIVPEKANEGVLLPAIRHTGHLKMPPGEKLPPEVIADFEAWIKMGAPDPRDGKAAPLPAVYDFEKARRHWAYQPVKDLPPPAVRDPQWSANGIDRYIKSKLDEKGLTPAGLASKRALLRRVTFDLTGLPPTPAEMQAFLADTSEGAYEKLIDRLLGSQAYGEKWGRHWLDVVRYADTAGCNSDFPVPDAWRYRNWVIQAFRNDKPYLEFLREQLAGDVLPYKDDEDRQAKLVATSYIALSRRFASNKTEHHLTIDDTIDNVGKAMLGLTVSCARCHDHKFDAIPQTDYFGWYGIFDSTVYTFPGVETFPRPHDYVALRGAADQKRIDDWETRLRGVHQDIRFLRFGEGRFRPTAREELKKLNAEALSIEIAPPDVPKAYAVKEGIGRNARMHYKGDPRIQGEEAPRGWLTVLGGGTIAEEIGSGRRQLADWITDPKNPLTARVMVNRIWQWHFGKGLVPTPNDFGVRGEAPSHPELLDWLAARFAESNYSVKAMHKLMLTSRAYRLASAHIAANAEKDPNNTYLWRANRRRLQAEEIRDAMLAVSGQLDPTPGGAHPFPKLHEWTYTQHRQFFARYDHNQRSVYLMQQRLRKHPLLELFDAADPNASTAARSESVTALQALALTNSEFVHQQADALAVRVGMAHSDTPSRLQHAHRLALGRPATPLEIAQGTQYLLSAKLALKDSPLPDEQKPRAALASYLRALLSSDEFFFVD